MRASLPIPCLLLLAAACALTNHPPALAPVGDHSVRVGETLVIDLMADDADGDSLSFAMQFLDPLPPTNAHLERLDRDHARFRWSPLISDATGSGRRYALRFVVEDGYGGADHADLTITVYRQEGIPVFLNPAGYVLDLSEREYISFDVEVKDDDNANVQIVMASGPTGALLDRTGGKTAEFYWRPTEEQIAAQLFHTVTFTADDGEHAPVTHEVGIVLLHAGAGLNCPGRPPDILHTPQADQVDGGDLVFEAFFSDGESHVALPSVRAVLAPGDERALAMQPAEAGLYRALIPASTLDPTRAYLVHYSFSARDDDDVTADRCDHDACLPKQGEFQRAWVGTLSGVTCVDDQAEPDGAGASAAPLEVGQVVERRLCAGDEDRFALAISDAGRVALRATNLGVPGTIAMRLTDPAGQTLATSVPVLGGARLDAGPLAGPTQATLTLSSPGEDNLSVQLERVDPGGTCKPDAMEPNDDPLHAPEITPGRYEDLVLCPGDIDAWRVPLAPGDNVSVTIRFRHQEGDLDLLILDEAGDAFLAASETQTDDEQVFLAKPGRPAITVAVLGFRDAANTYTLEIETGDDQALCQEDVFSPNHTAMAAATIIEGSMPDLVLCPGTEDWFWLGLNGGEDLEVRLGTATGNLDLLDVQARSPSSNAAPVACRTDPDVRVCTVAIDAPGAWRFGVSSSQGRVVYAMSAWAIEPAGCITDRLEPNDIPGSAPPLPTYVTSHLTLCGADQDWFTVDLGLQQTLAVRVLYVPSLGEVDMHVSDESGATMLASAVGQDGLKDLVFTPASAGRYRVLVWATSGAPFYDLVVVSP